MKKSDLIEIMRQTQAPLKNMVEMVPDDKHDWAPAEGFMTVGLVLKHLTGNWNILKMMVTQDWPFSKPEEMEEAMKLENMPAYTKGEIWKAALMTKEHQVAHKMQLHIYLKMLGLPVHTGTLYSME